jgi:oxepin-CoA hydrolase/3-oxo-5,6-dehydrosuberyl-CoA semialdehyde dehydrogenase
MDQAARNKFFEEDLPPLMEALQENHQAKFGLMQPQHMVEHLIWSLRSANGSQDLPIVNSEEKIPKFIAFLDTDIAIMPNFKNPLMKKETTEPLEFENLQAAKEAFWKEWEAYHAYYKDNPTAKTKNPVYGWCGKEEWDKLHFKHFLHHFDQFGLADIADYGLKPFERK